MWLKILTLVFGIGYLEGNILSIDKPRTFQIDYENNQFLKDGEPFRYISGSIHYFRIPPALWKDRLTKVRAMGINAITFYIQWNLHEPQPGNFTFEGDLNVGNFLLEAQKLGLVVLLRVGPYVCGEVNGGGMPFWLKQFHPNMKIRTNDPDYLHYVDRWWTVLFPIIRPYLYENGGPVVMVQMENEYGSYALATNDCTQIEYLTHLRDFARSHLGRNVLLYTTDGAGDGMVRCGYIPDVYPTVDFGAGNDPSASFAVQRRFASKGPLVNSEFYPGWLDHWGGKHAHVGTEAITKSLRHILDLGASINMYMVHGGTSFGFNAGANSAPFAPQPTSYDYDAPISEAGDLTDKYVAIRDVLKNYTTIPTMPVKNGTKANYGKVQLKFIGDVFSQLQKSDIFSVMRESHKPMTFEQLGQDNGFVLYQHIFKNTASDPAVLEVKTLHDRGYVFVDNNFVGILGRFEKVSSMPLQLKSNQLLQILVENQGRINFGPDMDADQKGVLSSVTLNGHTLDGWKMHGLPLSSLTRNKLVPQHPPLKHGKSGFWVGTFKTPCQDITANDTFLSTPGWGKGVAFVNGFNLGRYWPRVGPQMTLYVPAPLIKPQCQENEIVLFELETAGSCGGTGASLCSVYLVNKPKLDGEVPNLNPTQEARDEIGGWRNKEL